MRPLCEFWYHKSGQIQYICISKTGIGKRAHIIHVINQFMVVVSFRCNLITAAGIFWGYKKLEEKNGGNFYWLQVFYFAVKVTRWA